MKLFVDVDTIDTVPNPFFEPTTTKVHCRQTLLTWVITVLYQFTFRTLLVMDPKAKSIETSENPFITPPIDLDHIPLADKDFKITDLKCKFNFFESHFLLKDIFLDQSDKIELWESNFPLYMFPQSFHFSKFALKCQAHYFLGQRAIISSSSETLFTITP
jgi:hypothetical protein